MPSSPAQRPRLQGRDSSTAVPFTVCSLERSGSRTFLSLFKKKADSELAVIGSAPSPYIKLHWWPRPCPSSDWMPLRHIAASSTLPPSRRGRRLSPLTTVELQGGSPRSHGTDRPRRSTCFHALKFEFILLISLLTSSRQVNTKQPTVSSLPSLILSPLPLRSRTLSTNTAATTLQSCAPLLRFGLSFPY
jgi:hypothetical protein